MDQMRRGESVGREQMTPVHPEVPLTGAGGGGDEETGHRLYIATAEMGSAPSSNSSLIKRPFSPHQQVSLGIPSKHQPRCGLYPVYASARYSRRWGDVRISFVTAARCRSARAQRLRPNASESAGRCTGHVFPQFRPSIYFRLPSRFPNKDEIGSSDPIASLHCHRMLFHHSS